MLFFFSTSKPFWREAGHAGEYLNMSATSRDDGGSINDALIISYDATLPDGNAALMAFSNPQKVKGKSVSRNVLGLEFVFQRLFEICMSVGLTPDKLLLQLCMILGHGLQQNFAE